MHLFFVISICLMNSLIFCTNSNEIELFDTSPLSSESSAIVSTSTQLTSLSSLETSSKYSSSSTTTSRPYYPDTFNPGAIAGVAIGSFIFIFAISIGSYYIRRQRLYYLPYYNNYRPI